MLAPRPLRLLARVSLTQWILVALVAGFLIGAFAPQLVPWVRPFRGLFLNGVKCLIAPLLFGTLVAGIAGGHDGGGSAHRVGRLGLRAILYFEAATTVALVVGLAAVNLLQPGRGVHLAPATGAGPATETHVSFGGFVEHLLPSNLAEAILHGDVLQLVLFSSLFAFAALAVGPRARPVVAFCEALSDVMFKVTAYVMKLAPLGVGAALAASVADHGWRVILPLAKLVGTLYAALAVFLLVVLWPVAHLARVPLGRFVRELREPVVLAFATTSSESALPLALERLERLGVPRSIASFVLPLGYSFNLDGSTLYLAVASIFVAQAAGVPLSLGKQLLLMATLMLTTKGVAAVPRASTVVLSGTLVTFGLPLEGVALILAVDELMDMARTAVNLLGNCLATAVVARWEGVVLDGSAPPVRAEAAVDAAVETTAASG